MLSQINPTAQEAATLALSLSSKAKTLTNSQDAEFKISMVRWSDLDLQIPSAIFKPATEADVQSIVQHASKHKIPFVTKSGGSSSWSTICQEGWIIDLSLLQTLTLNSSVRTAKIQSGVLAKKLNEALSSINFHLPTPTGGGVAFIPFMLGGGSSPLSGMYGMASDSLLSARVVTASGEIALASEDENKELFWALKGAGQFFGVVTEVTMRMYEVENEITSFTLFYLPHQIENVAKELEHLINSDKTTRSTGMAAVLAPSGKTDPMIMVSITHFRPVSEIDAIMEPLLSIKPVNQIRKVIPWANITDSGDALSNPGSYKSIVSCGTSSFSAPQFISLLVTWKALVAENPDASGSFFMYTFYSIDGAKKFDNEGSAWSHRDVGVWAMLWVKAPTAETLGASIIHAERYIKQVQKVQKPDERSLFPNHTRRGDVRQRYRGEERLKKLKDLKKIWDGKGVFGSEFL